MYRLHESFRKNNVPNFLILKTYHIGKLKNKESVHPPGNTPHHFIKPLFDLIQTGLYFAKILSIFTDPSSYIFFTIFTPF